MWSCDAVGHVGHVGRVMQWPWSWTLNSAHPGGPLLTHRAALWTSARGGVERASGALGRGESPCQVGRGGGAWSGEGMKRERMGGCQEGGRPAGAP
jgi:hypothetical protein